MLDGVSSLPPYVKYGYSELTGVQPQIRKIFENEFVRQGTCWCLAVILQNIQKRAGWAKFWGCFFWFRGFTFSAS
jgi:hypothetical protein